ncbi:MAG: Serine/threonine-protein kinase PknD [bacterium ADurb.Bin431]|nr:MAG: Serine/threonine-protein kinase PknD [bacterium ADurb.Bin431]
MNGTGRTHFPHLTAAALWLLLWGNPAQAGDSLVVRFLYAFGKEGGEPGQFRSPSALSIDPEGALYLADAGNNRIQKLSVTGEVLAMTGGFGWGINQFHRPADLCAENGLDLYVADYENRRIIRCDRDLHWIDAYYYPAGTDDKLNLGFPAGIALSIHNDLFVTDAENLRVLRLNGLREAVYSFGDFSEGEGELAEPQKITIDREDRILVSDRLRSGIVVFDYFGNYLHEIGAGVLKEPAGLQTARNGALFVADTGRDQVLVFSQSGALLAAIGSAGDKLGALANPIDVAVSGDRLFVAEAGNHRIQVFELQWLQIP